MKLFNNDIENDYIEIINDYFNQWGSIRNAEEYKNFSSKIPPFFGTYKTTSILDQIENFIEQGTKIEINETTYKLFKDEVKNILEDLQIYN